jgi:DNA-directed RNA polymerase subunit RPC12/RpoP
MEQNPLQEQCSQCGSSNVYLVEHRMSPWDVLATISRSFGLFSPLFLALHVIGKEKQRRQDKQYRCSRCNKTWNGMRSSTLQYKFFQERERKYDETST